jgi:hypothetical protein
MNPNPETIGQRRIAREDCEIGDWVEATLVPEWSAEQSSYVFRRAEISISPVDGGMGGILPDQSQECIFVAEDLGNGLVWVRKS